jgi:hypothetical protein
MADPDASPAANRASAQQPAVAEAWQVVVQTRVLRTPQLESIGDLDWESAVKFALPSDKPASRGLDESRDATWPAKGTMSISTQSVSWEYTPFLACVIDQRQMDRILDRFQGDRRFSLSSCPKVSVYSGQRAAVCDESYRPFVVGVSYVKGELATAAQPEIAVLAEGMNVEIQPTVIGADALDLRCELTVSHIDGVSEIKLPGKDVTIQNPCASRQSISARCQITPGQTLLIAPIDSKQDGEDANAVIYAITAKWSPSDRDANASVRAPR